MTTIYFYYYFSSIPFVANHVVLCPFKERYCCVSQCCTWIRFNCTSKLDVLRIFKLYHYTSCKTRSARVQQSEQPFLYHHACISTLFWAVKPRCSILFRQYDIRICNNWKVHNNLTYEQQQQQPFKHNQHRWSHLNRLYASHPKQFYSYLG